MIIDSLENINNYNVVSNSVLKFLNELSTDIKTGRYKIDEQAYANIEEYNTKNIQQCKFEAHKKYIDIQILLSGTEELDFLPVDGLAISDEYDEHRDIMFFTNPDKISDRVILEPGKFAMIYPHEAHKPQMSLNGISEQVKKVVVKILI